jgi:hypothetical protein
MNRIASFYGNLERNTCQTIFLDKVCKKVLQYQKRLLFQGMNHVSEMLCQLARKFKIDGVWCETRCYENFLLFCHF